MVRIGDQVHTKTFAYLCVYATITDSVVPYILHCNSLHLNSMFLMHLEFSLSFVPPNQILRVNWFRTMTMCILLIN